MQKVIIVHGCYAKSEDKSASNRHWIPWVKKELMAGGVKAETPDMPRPWAPVYEDFKKEFEKNSVSEDSVLVGHSCGCAFLVRWLGESKKKIAKLILVAPWNIAETKDEFRSKFYDYQIDEAIQSRVGEIIMFTSDDESEIGKKSLEIFRAALGGKIINLPNHGHYTLGDMGTTEFPELLERIVEEEDEEEEDEEEEEQEESRQESKKISKPGSALKTISTLVVGTVFGVAVGAGVATMICENTNSALISEHANAPINQSAAVSVPSSSASVPRSATGEDASAIPGASGGVR